MNGNVVRLYNATKNTMSEEWYTKIRNLNAGNFFIAKTTNNEYCVVDGSLMLTLLKTKYEIDSVVVQKGVEYFIVRENNKQGIMNAKGKLLLPFKYEKITMFSPDFIRVFKNKSDQKYAYTNLKQSYTTAFNLEFDWEINSNYYKVS